MNNAQLIKLAAVLTVLVALIFGRKVWNQYQTQRPNEFRQAVAQLNMDNLNKIVVSQANDVVELNNEGGSWKVASKSADRAMIEDLVVAFTPTENPLLISESPQQKESLRVNDTDGYKVAMSFNGGEQTFMIGPKVGSGNPVALGDGTKVFSISAMPKLYADPDRWVDLTVVDIDPSAVKELSWGDFGLIKSEDGMWQFNDGGAGEAVNQDEVTTLLSEFNPLEAKGLAYEQKQAEYDLTKPIYTLSITDNGGQVTTLMLYKGKIDYLLKRIENEEYFLVKDETGTTLNKLKVDFVEKAEE